MVTSVVVVLGAPNDDDGKLSPQALSRVRAAVAVLAGRVGALVLPTGGFGDHFNRTSTPHHRYLHRALVRSGVDPAFCMSGVESANTYEDAVGVRDALAGAGLSDADVVVVTSDFHVGRARWHFEQALTGCGVEFVGASSEGIESSALERLRAHERLAMERLRQT